MNKIGGLASCCREKFIASAVATKIIPIDTGGYMIYCRLAKVLSQKFR
jgi:hypothetical protein